jgi:copper transport protein
LLVGSDHAFAHAVLVDTSPADGATVRTSPPLLALRFNEPVRPVAVRLLDREGRLLNAPDAVHAIGAEISVHIRSPLQSGEYVLSYRVISADAHPVGGSIVFGVGPNATTGHVQALERDPWRVPYLLVRLLFYATLLPAAGGVLFLGLIEVPSAARAIIRRGLQFVTAGAAAAGVLNLAAKGAQLASSTLVDPAAWLLAASVSFGSSIVLALIGLAAISIGLRGWPRRNARWLAYAGAVAAAGSFALTGHAATLPPRWLAVLLMTGHLLPIAFWVGALWPLIMVLHRTPEAGPVIVARFSRHAVGAVVILMTCGIGMAAVELGSPAALATSDYGQSLLFKLAFVVALLVLASLNKWVLLPDLGMRSVAPRKWLVRSIRAEGGVALVIFAITAVLSTTSPPRAVTAAHGSGAVVQAMSGSREAIIELTPAVAGQNGLTIHLMNDGKPFEPREVTLELALPEAGIESIRRPLVAVGSGHYHWTGVVPMAGRWRARVEVLITDFEKIDFSAELPVR